MNPTWTLRQGDAWDLAAELREKSVNAIVTSPPYWGHRTYGHEQATDILGRWTALGNSRETTPPYDWYRDEGGALGLESYPAWFVDHLVQIFGELAPALADDGSLWVNLGDTYFARWSSLREGGRQGLGTSERTRRVTPSGGVLHDKQLLLIPAQFALAMQRAGWILRNDLIWHKPHVAPRPEKDRLRQSHEHFFHFVKRQRSGRPRYFYDLSGAEDGAVDVVTVGHARGDGSHSATFPTELIAPRIRSSCPEGGLVLDPFCGTGTTLISAVEQGRNAVGFELSDTFVREARARLRTARFGMETQHKHEHHTP